MGILFIIKYHNSSKFPSKRFADRYCFGIAISCFFISTGIATLLIKQKEDLGNFPGKHKYAIASVLNNKETPRTICCEAEIQEWVQHNKKTIRDRLKVILYFNGQLIDMGTKFYRRLGKKISIKRADGTEHMERYPFGGDGTALRVFGNKTFVTACPGTKEWLNILKSFVDRAVEIGVDGIEFDQLGYKSEFCYDKSHGHSVPCQDIMLLKSKMLGELRAYVRQKKPDMPLYIEWMSDPTSMHADFIHNCVVNLHIADTDKNGVPITRYAPMYQYTFPETYTTDRDIYNNSDVPRRNNLAVMRGWRSDVAVYRCRATIGETPVYKSYLTEINRLRDRFRDLILNGVFRDTDMAKSDNPLLEYSTFTTWDGEKMAVVVAQSHFDFARVQFTPADGYEYLEDGGIGSFKVLKNENNKATVELKRNDIAVIVFKKASSANRNVDKGAGILQSAL